ncbi:hypothetical protein Csa_022361, partial [Cucumis sativus]
MHINFEFLVRTNSHKKKKSQECNCIYASDSQTIKRDEDVTERRQQRRGMKESGEERG